MTLLHDAELSSAFDHASLAYDRLVAANPGYHAHLRRSARRLGLPHGGAGLRVLDLGCGTGASTAALLAAAPYAEIVAVDASAGMLAQAAAKEWPAHVRFVHSPVEGLADGPAVDRNDVTARGRYDAVFAAYLFRNVTDPDATLASTRELLAPGGRLTVHEYSLAEGRAHRALWSSVCRSVVMPLGRAAGDGELYRHLWRSVLDFDTAPAFAERLGRAGFEEVRVLPLPGWQTGITHTFVARAPRRSGDRGAA
ncbi:methyltransferase [Streptomyces sp. NBC_00102]|uniref:methyltransferase n=1 Tax=Streptomyces sp. NBC_00102 TaxID=2975652 RepID=UPI00225810E5|nr:methyltransferase [Streptomyces sp. NBC_00102]MCX5401262.1 class I SAM-dependent methyltransferase [Streptomyces sp. NBC_00102]